MTNHGDDSDDSDDSDDKNAPAAPPADAYKLRQPCLRHGDACMMSNKNVSRSDGESGSEISDSDSDSSDDGADDPDDLFDAPPPPEIDTNIMPIAPASNAAGGALSPATPAQSPNPVASSAAASKKRKRRGGIDLVDWDPMWFQKRRRRSATTRTYSEMKGENNFVKVPTVVHMAQSVRGGNNVELAVSWVISEDPEGPWRHI